MNLRLKNDSNVIKIKFFIAKYKNSYQKDLKG